MPHSCLCLCLCRCNAPREMVRRITVGQQSLPEQISPDDCRAVPSASADIDSGTQTRNKFITAVCSCRRKGTEVTQDGTLSGGRFDGFSLNPALALFCYEKITFCVDMLAVGSICPTFPSCLQRSCDTYRKVEIKFNLAVCFTKCAQVRVCLFVCHSVLSHAQPRKGEEKELSFLEHYSSALWCAAWWMYRTMQHN